MPVRLVVSVPPRHGKTELILHSIAWHLQRDPACEIAYIGYSQTFARSKSKKARALARAAGVDIRADSKSANEWRTGHDDGGVIATGRQGNLTGNGFDIVIVDDPFSGRAEAESQAVRDSVWDFFVDDVYTRLKPGGSCIVCQTRWHVDDLAGRLLADPKWKPLNLPAINDDGEALWPELWPVSVLNDRRSTLGEYGWWSLFQGEPRPRGGALFRDVRFSELVPEGSRYAIGYDLAYSAKTYADYAVAVVLAERDGIYTVVEVCRAQCETPVFGRLLRQLAEKYPRAPVTGFVSGTEKGVVQMLRTSLVPGMQSLNATADKFVRAQPVSAAWNAGKVRLLRDSAEAVSSRQSWQEVFLDELLGFTGVNDRHDDQVDALAGAFAGLSNAQPMSLQAAKTSAGMIKNLTLPRRM